MKKLRLIGVRSQKEELLRELMLLGCVEVSDPAGRSDREELTAFRRSDGGKVWQKRSDQTTIVNALRLLDKHAPAKKGLLTPKPEVECEKLLDESALEADLALAGEILSLDAEARGLLARASRERAAAEAMSPWTALNVPLERMETQSCETQLGTLSAAVPMEEVNAALAPLEISFDLVSEDKTSRYVSLFFRREDRETVTAALRPLGFSAISLPEGTGTPEQIRADALSRSEELTAQAAKKIEELASYAPHRDALQLGADTLSTRIAREETAEKLLQSDSTFYFEGWLTAPEEKKLGETLSKYCCAWETEEPDPEHPEEVPIQLRNNALTRPYNIVTEMYSLPAYNGLDPNPFIMPFFALFFGIMFADMAYGLILLIAGLLFLWKAKPKGSMKNAAGLLIECGISTFIIGFLTGGFFGDVVSVIGGWFGKDWSIVPHLGTIHLGSIVIDLPLNLLEGNNPLYVLVAAICLGAIHLAVGVGIGVYLKFKDGEWADALLNDLCWWVMMAGILVMMTGGTKIVLFVGIGMMVLGQLITGKGFGKITGIFSAIYNGATGYLGDLLSYSRLMALMLAGSVIASVFNQLGSLGNANGMTVGGTILFVLVFCIGHALNFALNLIGCFVHTLRLQFLEFFGKWYRDGGKAFRPLKIQTKYVDIKEE